MGFRTLFDQRSRVAACWQGAREAGELNPTLSANSSRPQPKQEFLHTVTQ